MISYRISLILIFVFSILIQENLFANTNKSYYLSKLIDTNWLNVRDFGVKPDGISDNTISLQKAINFASHHKKTIYFPVGIYLTKAITLASNLSIIGEGKNSVIKAITPTASNYKFGSVLYSWYNSNYKNITIKNITLDGSSNLSDTSKKAAVANFSSCSNIVFNEVTIINGQSVGIALEKSEDIIIDNCTFENFGWSAIMAIGITNAIFTKNKTTGWSKINLDKSPAWSFPSLSSKNVIINNNFFFNSSNATEYGIELYGAYSYNFNISNNIFDANGFKGSGISGAFKFSNITNNKFLNGTGNQRCGLEVSLDTSIVSDNIIQNGSIASFPFPFITHVQRGGIIKNNFITNNLANGYAIMVAGSSSLDTTYNFEISGNTINVTNDVNSAIIVGWYGYKGNYKDITVFNNNINASQKTNGIRFYGYSGKNVRVYNNYINGSLSGITNDAGSVITGYFDISNNVVINSATKLAVKTSSKSSVYNNRVNNDLVTSSETSKELENKINLNTISFFISNNHTIPTKKNSIGKKGEIRITSTHIYLCIEENKWIKASLLKW